MKRPYVLHDLLWLVGIIVLLCGCTELHGSATKILWIVDHPQASGPLQINGTNLFDPGKTFHQTIAGSGEIPSIVDVSIAGCWRLQIVSGNANGTLILWVEGKDG